MVNIDVNCKYASPMDGMGMLYALWYSPLIRHDLKKI